MKSLKFNPVFVPLFVLAVALFSSLRAGVAEEYRLGTGDTLAVTVLRHPELSIDQIAVPADGKIRLPVTGEVTVAGKTSGQLEQEITDILSARLRHPEVTVTLKQARPQLAFVMGAVTHPGAVALAPNWRITDVLAQAGGLAVRPEMADTTLSRLHGKQLTIDLPKILNDSNQPANIRVEDGDTITVMPRTILVSVAGEVAHPGTYEVARHSNAVEAVAAAGGATNSAALARATLQHTDGKTEPVDLYKTMVLGDKKADVELQAGDMILIPAARTVVSVLGAVQKPGLVPIPDGKPLKLSEALALAGTAAPAAALSKATLQHANGQMVNINLYAAAIEGDTKADIELTPDDVLRIPTLRGITVLGAVQKPGTYMVDDVLQAKVSDLLAQAGGLTVKPEEAHITIARPLAGKATAPRVVEAANLFDLRDATQNATVRDGDIITVNAIRAEVVSISGEVQKPGVYTLREGDSIAELIAQAGGGTSEGMMRQVTLTERGGTTQIVDLYGVLHNEPNHAPLPALHDGDLVIVPRSTARITVMPGVNKPGDYAFPESGRLTVGEALTLAGGPKDGAKVNRITVLRKGPNGVERRDISLVGKGNTHELAMNETLQPGDLVYVPQRASTNGYASGLLAMIGILLSRL